MGRNMDKRKCARGCVRMGEKVRMGRRKCMCVMV